jgi:hypothetical protein
MRLGFIIPEPNWDITFPDIDLEEWIDEDEE